MADTSHWEARFVDEFIIASKRERYLGFLKGPKNRKKALERLNHSLDYDPRKSATLPKDAGRLLAFLIDRDVADTCHFMADAHRDDGKEMRTKDAVEALVESYFGALMICPYRGSHTAIIAVYKPEDPSDLIVLS